MKCQNTAREIWQCFLRLSRKNSWEIPGEYEWLFKLESFVNKLCFGILFLNLFGESYFFILQLVANVLLAYETG